MRSEDLIQLAAAKGALPEGMERADAMSQTPVGLSDWLIVLPVMLPLLMGVIGIMMRAYPV